MKPAPQRRRRRWRLLFGAAAALLVVLAFGCTSTIVPPPHPERPTTVFLLREAMHTGLVLPPDGDSGEYVEFGFGDWSWFALGHDAWYDVFATVLWPTQGTLCRRTFAARDEAQLRARVSWAELSSVVVDGDRVRALRVRLQQQFDAAAAGAVRRPELGWTFVPIDRSYWFANNCADVTAEWFVALGCYVGCALIRVSLAVGRAPEH